jgi:poly(A) polymerase
VEPLRQGANEVAAKLRAAGYEAYLAGGCVRDVLRGVPPKDYDIATNARPDEVSRLFKRTVLVGAAFGVVRVVLGKGLEYEVATYRADGVYSDGRRPDEVVYSKSKEEDVRRRDFTINALLMDPATDEVIDLVGGREDLDKRIIRAVGDPAKRFGEDRLRMLRAVRFAARLGFDIEERTFAEIVRHASAIAVVSIERIVAELKGIWMSPDPARGFDLLGETGLLARVIPFWKSEAPYPIERERLERVRNAEGPDEDRALLAWAALIDLLELPRNEREAQLRDLKLSTNEIRAVLRLVDARDVLIVPKSRPLAERVKLASDPRRALFLSFAQVLTGDSDAVRILRDTIADVDTRPLPPLNLVTGEDLKQLGYAQGPRFKEILSAVETEILERRITDRAQALHFVRARFPA